MTLVQAFNSTLTQNKQFPQLAPGMTVRVHQKITEGTGKNEKQRIQIFEGIIIAKKGNHPAQCTITVRKISNGVGVERIFSLISPSIEKIEAVKQSKVRRAKLYYLRNLRGKASRLREVLISRKEQEVLKEREAEDEAIHAAKLQKVHATSESTRVTVETPDETLPATDTEKGGDLADKEEKA